MIIQFGILMTCLCAGEFVVKATGLPVPGSIVGMLLLTAALQLKVINLRHIDNLATFLVHNIGFFFVPAGVGLMNCMGLIAEQWLPIVVATVGSTVVIMAVTGHVHQVVRKTISHHPHPNKDKSDCEVSKD